jgi:prophage tail gpP-like protein
MSDVVLTVNGKDYSGWESVDITLSMEAITGTFNLSMSDNIPSTGVAVVQPPQLIPGQSAKVSVNGEVVITGWIDKVSPMVTKDSHVILVQGRDVTGDLVDCSVVQPINQWKNLQLEQIVARLCQPFNIPVTVDVDSGLILDYFVIEQGATCFEAIQKLCYMRQCLAVSDGQGSLNVTRSGTATQATTAIIEGQNMRECTSDFDYAQRYSVYVCKGQRQGDDNTQFSSNTLNVAKISDPLITRYRPLLIIYDGQATLNDCNNRAKWEAANRRGKSIKLTVTVAGWTQADGSLWIINSTVYFKSVFMGFNQNLLISAVNFKFDDQGGELTILTLTSVEAYTINKPIVLKTDAYLT